MAADLAGRLTGIETIGLGERGTNRLAWTAQDAEAGHWFAEQAAGVGLQVARDPAGNLWARPDAPAPWWGVGSHLDSVRDGGRFDGALGVAAGFEVAARTRAPVAVVAFADEEGARFNTPTFGSRALVGRLDVAEALARVDDDGVTLADALAGAGVDPARVAEAPTWLDRLRGFLELHIDQSRAVRDAGAALGVVSELAALVRVRIELTGQAAHAATRERDRRDALATAAVLIGRAGDLAFKEHAMVVTATRIVVEPNALTTIAGRVDLWLDARGPDPTALAGWHARLLGEARRLEAETRVTVAVEVAAQSDGVAFDPGVAQALREAAGRLGHDAPDVFSYAGHDAGILAERLPAGMVFVRNETGRSHAPEEHVELDDAARAAQVLLVALEALAA